MGRKDKKTNECTITQNNINLCFHKGLYSGFRKTWVITGILAELDEKYWNTVLTTLTMDS